MIKPLLKFEIVGDKTKFFDILNTIKELGIVHIEEYPQKYKFPDITIENEEIYKRARVLISDIEHLLGEFPIGEKFINIEEGTVLELESILNTSKQLISKKEEISSKLNLLNDYYSNISKIYQFKEPKIILIVIKKDLEQFKKLNIENSLIVKLREEKFAILIYEDVRDLIYSEGFNEFKLPMEYEGLTIKQAYEKISNDIRSLKEELLRIENEIKRFRVEISEKFSNVKLSVLEKFEDLNILRKYATFSQYTFFLKGWVIKDKKDKLISALKKFENYYFIKFEEPHVFEYEKVPTLINPSNISKPFKRILDFFGHPKYGTIDPTFFLWLFFPPYFGMMLGDIGYAFIMLIIVLFFRYKFIKNVVVKDLTAIYIWALSWAILFGFLYGEAFGELFYKLGILKPIIHRTHSADIIIGISILLGVVQIILGIIFGILINLRLKDSHLAFYEIFRLVGLVGIILIGLVFLKIIQVPIFLYIALFFVAIGIIGVTITHGPIAVIELVSTSGQILSFARIAAVALASAVLAEMGNMFFSMVPVLIFGILIALIFHVLAFVLGFIDPTIQGMRLQVVEFFLQFYKTSEKVFRPLKRGGLNYVS
ncbi:MAG: V-type ATPase 116kDa subunit family protein [candidate division WOR-3 bacterium]